MLLSSLNVTWDLETPEHYVSFQYLHLLTFVDSFSSLLILPAAAQEQISFNLTWMCVQPYLVWVWHNCGTTFLYTNSSYLYRGRKPYRLCIKHVFISRWMLYGPALLFTTIGSIWLQCGSENIKKWCNMVLVKTKLRSLCLYLSSFGR